MRKTPAALVSTAAGLAAVLALHMISPAVSTANGTLPSSTSNRSSSRTAPSSPSSTQPGTSSTQPGTSSSAVGASEQYGFGVLSVKATLTGHRIDDVSVVSLQTAESYSQSLAQQAIPILRKEVLAAQSAHVNAVSGATYTSEAYLYSLQSALDKLQQ